MSTGDSLENSGADSSRVRPVIKPTAKRLTKPSTLVTVKDSVAAKTGAQRSSPPKEKTVISFSGEKIKLINLYGSHELKPMHKGPQALNRETPDWIFPMLVLITLAFAGLRTFYTKYFNQMIAAFFNNNLTNQIVRDENILVQRATILLNIVFNLVAALFLYFVSIRFNWQIADTGTGLTRYLFFAILISAAYTLKFLVLKICGYLFNLEREMAAYIFNIFLINNILGILLLPSVALLAFSSWNLSWIINVSLAFTGMAFLYRITRGFLIGIASPAYTFNYLFLYLCTLEFAPLAVLIKILTLK